MTKRVLLTGATGYLGRHILRDLLRDGHAVTAVARRRGARSAEERVRSVLFPGGDGNLSVLEGDITLPHCGLAPEAAAELAGRADAVVHCAGLTEFDAGLAVRLREQNVAGTRNAFALCRALKAPQFHHVGTAFVAGDARSVFSADDFDAGQRFKNPYEESKFEAEKFLRAAADGPVIVTIYRPSIVVGGKALGEDGSAGTLYAYLKALRFIRECFRRDARGKGELAAKYGASADGDVWNIPLRVEADEDLKINLIHVDDVSRRILRNIRRPRGAGGVHHVTSEHTYLLSELKDEFCRALGIRGLRLVPASRFAERRPTGLEEKFRRMTGSFQPYLHHMPLFAAGEAAGRVDLQEIVEDFLAELESAGGPAKEQSLGSAALEGLDLKRPGKYLDRFSKGEFGESLLKRIPFIEARVEFRIRGNGESPRTLVFDKGSVRAGLVDKSDDADFVYEMDEDVFREVVAGKLDPREAFFKGALKIHGNQELALKFGYIFTEHFMNIDGRILEELKDSAA